MGILWVIGESYHQRHQYSGNIHIHVFVLLNQGALCSRLIARLLVRDPENRASLGEILQDPWLQQGEVSTIPIMPLISRQDISDEDHAYIVQKMVDGKIASKEEILQ